MKKILSLVLATALVISSTTFAFAAKFSDVTGDYTKAITALNGLGVISGYPDGTFKPANSITRAETAKLLVEALGYKDLVSGSKANFSDTNGHWAEGYLALATGLGLTAGYPDGSFKPDQTISYDEVLTMIVRALGYTDASLKGTWPTNYKVKAIDLEVTKDVVMNKSLADRGGVAQAIYNALEKELVTVSDENIATPVKTGALTLIDKIAVYEDEFTVTPEKLDKDHKDYAGKIVDLAPYMYQSLEVYMNDDEEVVYVKDTNSLAITGTIDTTNVEYKDVMTKLPIKDAAGKVTLIDTTSAAVFYNGAEKDGFSMSGLKAYNGAPNNAIESITVVAKTDLNSNDKIEANEITGLVIAQQTKVSVIDNAYKAGRTNLDGYQLPVDGSDLDLNNITVTGAASSLEEIKADDVVVYYESLEGADEDVVKLVVSRKTVEGEITRVDQYNTAVYIDGVKYAVNREATDVYDATNKVVSLAVENNGTFYLDFAGKVVAFEESAKEGDNYAVVVATGAGIIESNGVIENTYSIKNYPAIKLATANDEVVIYDVYVEIDDETKAVDKSAEDETGAKIVVTSGTALNLTQTLAQGTIVKYSLNAKGQIEVIEIPTNATLTNVDTTNANFDLAQGAVIFNGKEGKDFAVVKSSSLEDAITGKGVYNNNGELEVIITANVDAEATDTTIAQVKAASEVNTAKNAAGDDVQIATVYMNGTKQEVITDGDVEFNGAGIYELELEGNLVVGVTTTSATTATIADISTATNKVKLGETWYAIASDATMLRTKADTTTWEFIDIYDLDENTSIDVITKDGEITYMFLSNN